MNRTVRALRIIMLIVATVSVVVFVPWDIVPWITPLPDTVQQQVDDATNHGLDGIIVYVDRAGRPPALYAAGWKDRAAQVPADPEALFKIASISKLYIAAAAAKLVADGSLSLDGTLADYLPDLAGRIEHANRITVRMLLRHRSGIPDFIAQSGFDWFTPHRDTSKQLGSMLDEPADFEPDARSGYSDTNDLLLGRILDDALGYSHQRYIATEILDPLGLTDTYGVLDQAPCDDVASGYWYGYDDDLRDLDFVTPVGSMIATASDVGVFLRALYDDERAVYASVYEYEHFGWLPGYDSVARYHEDIDTVLVQFVSTTGGDTWGISNVTGGKALGIANIIYGRIVRILRRQRS